MELITISSRVLAKCEGVEEPACSVWLQRRATALVQRSGYREWSSCIQYLDDDDDDDLHIYRKPETHG